ncbi:MAG: hypothetical protein KTR31_41790 [Myxococcales bacterium]|nr:hypothetical protein [Myxococcales bacterium]
MRRFALVLMGSGCSGGLSLITDTDTDTDTQTDTYTETETEVVDTATPQTIEFSDLSWKAHPEVGSFVYVSWMQDVQGDVTVDYRLEGESDWMASPVILGQAGENTQLIAGIPYGSRADYRLTAVNAEGGAEAAERIETEPLDNRVNPVTIEESDPSAWYADGKYLLVGGRYIDGGASHIIMYDREGRAVWALYPEVTYGVGRDVRSALAGDHLVFDLGGDQIVRRYVDDEIESVAVANDNVRRSIFVERPDGAFVWPLLEQAAPGYGDIWMERDPVTGATTQIWDCHDVWPIADTLQYGCFSDSIDYRDTIGSYLFSTFVDKTGSAIVEVDSTGDVVWVAGASADSIAFSPPTARFSIVNSAKYTSDDTILVDSTSDAGKTLAEYRVDRANDTLTRLWRVDAPTNGFSASADLTVLGNSNLLFADGGTQDVFELDATGNTVWHMTTVTDNPRLWGTGRVELLESLYDLMSPSETANLR